MLSVKRFVSGVVDELMANALQAGATEVDVKVQRLAQGIRIEVRDNGKGMTPAVLQEVQKTLNRPRRNEYDHYYGELAGETLVGRGLTIVSMLVDDAHVESSLGEGSIIVVFRKLSEKENRDNN